MKALYLTHADLRGCLVLFLYFLSMVQLGCFLAFLKERE